MAEDRVLETQTFIRTAFQTGPAASPVDPPKMAEGRAFEAHTFRRNAVSNRFRHPERLTLYLTSCQYAIPLVRGSEIQSQAQGIILRQTFTLQS